MLETPKKKILLVITKSNFGGAQRYVYDLATSLPKENFDVAVVFGEGGELEEKLQKANIRTIKIESLKRDVNIFKDFSVFFELIKIFKEEKPDVVHLNSTKIGALGVVAAKLSKVHKIIFTAHGWAFNEKRSYLSRKAIALIQWFTVVVADITIAVSQKTADQILFFPFIKKEKIKVIYNGVSNIQFIEKKEARKILKTGLAEDSIWIGTISELHHNKGLDIAINAFSQIAQTYSNTYFFIIGAGQEKDALVEQIKKLELSDRVFLTGFIKDAKIYLKAFDIFTLTSRTEALPYAIIEAGLAGLPVVASSVGGIPEIINSSEVGILTPTDDQQTASVSDALENFILKTEQRKMLGQNLRQRIISEYSLEKMQKETFALYE